MPPILLQCELLCTIITHAPGSPNPVKGKRVRRRVGDRSATGFQSGPIPGGLSSGRDRCDTIGGGTDLTPGGGGCGAETVAGIRAACGGSPDGKG